MLDEPITLPPIGSGRVREADYWTPKNYDGGGGGTMTLRRALENSRNLATVRLLDGGIEKKPEASLDRFCALALEAQIYRECARYYPIVLGAQPVRPIDLAAFYAAIANEGMRPEPHVIDTIERNGLIIYRHDPASATAIASVDRAAFYQLKTMLQGVLARGTARSMAGLAPYVAGKTGTTDDENDAWFVGFTNDVTVAVWVGYDNADGKRRTLGGGAHRRPHRGADLRADHAGGVGARRAQDRAGAAVARSAGASSRARPPAANWQTGNADRRRIVTVCAWMQEARCSILSIAWCRARAHLRRGICGSACRGNRAKCTRQPTSTGPRLRPSSRAGAGPRAGGGPADGIITVPRTADNDEQRDAWVVSNKARHQCSCGASVCFRSPSMGLRLGPHTTEGSQHAQP